MLVRCNTVARGHSSVSLRIIETMVALLQNDLTPVIPLRGSISASGDLSPLSYVAGIVTGNPDVYVQSPSGIISAKQALEQLNFSPAILGPKEGLGLMNGTATSAAVGSLALYEAHQITVLSQLLTAMALEALLGTVANYDSFIAEVRPHRGQMESARHIRHFLQGSRLARDHDDDARQSRGLLYQDRYALRTASQWVGPQMEDLLLAHEQVTIELNSTTDNPLVDVPCQRIHHGGNFQAVSITSAMEKARLALQMVGNMLFAQCSELINPMLNNGLPPNLAADEPSLSYTMKGVDIGMASYMSELAFLANPISSHVQSAEMHNQAINSLAFLSARYTLHAVELSSLMSASYLYTVCQALDLRVLQVIFFQTLKPALHTVNLSIFGPLLSDTDFDELNTSLWDHVQSTWHRTGNEDSQDRYTHVIEATLAVVSKILLFSPTATDPTTSSAILKAIASWRSAAHRVLADTYATTRTRFFQQQNTAGFLGRASRKMYLYMRQTLGVPFHQGLIDHPTPTAEFAANGSKKKTIGSWIAIIYEALRSGRLHEPLMECLVETGAVSSAS
jgi:phenylalanine ammonia-lyase